MEFDSVFIVIVGLIIGSFLNMLIYRLPKGISLFNPKRSQCTNCNHTITILENIPILSYCILKGKCSSCKTKISLIYPFVESITALITYITYQKLGLNLEFYFVCTLLYMLIILSFIDLKYKAVPDILLVLLSFVILLYLFLFNINNFSLYFMFAGGIITLELFVTYYIQNIKSKILRDDRLQEQKALGEGDVPIIALIGGFLGLQLGLFAIFLSAILAIIPSLINIISKKEIETPFIPYLSCAFFITFIYENEILQILGRL